ncbi:MAG TPA: hypothetical protein VF614_10595 [Chthoniobacteraceae bacterium]
MSPKIVACIVMGVFTAHLGLFALLSHLRPKPPKMPPPLERNFRSREATVEDPSSGEKTTYREITVSTRLAE